jgi:hypothetical protein
MTGTATTRMVQALAVGVVLVALSGGCAPKATPAPAQSAVTTGVPQIARMSADKKRSEIASSFPIEVPVPEGRVLRGEAQGADVWDYQLEMPKGAADVVTWYMTWYPKAEWQLIGDEVAGAGRRLTFSKGGYAADITVTPDGSDRTKVTAIVGMGQPVLNTQ